MKKLVLIPVLLLFFSACKKENEPSPTDESLTSFLAETSPVFIANIQDKDILWEPVGRGSSSLAIASDDPNPSNPARSLTFDLITDYQTSVGSIVSVSTPFYTANSYTEFENTFGLGSKTTGESGKNFFISVKMGDRDYFRSEMNNSGNIEILKTQEFDGQFGQAIRVWYKINAELKSTFNQGTLTLKDALLLAEYSNYR